MKQRECDENALRKTYAQFTRIPPQKFIGDRNSQQLEIGHRRISPVTVFTMSSPDLPELCLQAQCRIQSCKRALRNKCAFCPRIWRSSRSESSSRLRPPYRTLPKASAPRRRLRPRIAVAIVLLPEPLSPAMPSISASLSKIAHRECRLPYGGSARSNHSSAGDVQSFKTLVSASVRPQVKSIGIPKQTGLQNRRARMQHIR